MDINMVDLSRQLEPIKEKMEEQDFMVQQIKSFFS